MLYRTLLPFAVLAVAACSAQKTRPPVDEPTSTTTVTRAALTIPATTETAPATVAPREQTSLEATLPLAPKYRDALARNPALDGVSLEHVQVDQVDGHVILRGRLPTVADKVEVEMTVRQMKGVTSIRNDIRPLR